MTIRAWFIRHGQSESNAGLRTAWPDMVHLTPTGRLQAENVAAALPAAPDLFVTSPYIRTQETAAPALARFPEVPHVEWPVQEFTYLTPSVHRNTTMQDRWPAAQAYWETADPALVDGPGAESFAAFINRTQAALTRVREAGRPWTVIFSHGMVIRAMLWLVLTRPAVIDSEQLRRYRHFLGAVKMPNASIWSVAWDEAGVMQLAPFQVDHLPPTLRTG